MYLVSRGWYPPLWRLIFSQACLFVWFFFLGGGGGGGGGSPWDDFWRGGGGWFLLPFHHSVCSKSAVFTPRADKGDVVYINALFGLNILIKIVTTTSVLPAFHYIPLASKDPLERGGISSYCSPLPPFLYLNHLTFMYHLSRKHHRKSSHTFLLLN